MNASTALALGILSLLCGCRAGSPPAADQRRDDASGDSSAVRIDEAIDTTATSADATDTSADATATSADAGSFLADDGPTADPCSPAGQVCDDGNGCTVDSCDPASGCQHIAQPGSCDDGTGCTIEGKCADGKCVSAAKYMNMKKAVAGNAMFGGLVDVDGGFALSGTDKSSGSSTSTLFRLDGNGVPMWQKTLSWPVQAAEQAFGIIKHGNGFGILLATFGTDLKPGESAVVHTDLEGNVQWGRDFGLLTARRLAPAPDGGMVVVGGGADYKPAAVWLERLDVQGKTAWSASYGTTSGANLLGNVLLVDPAGITIGGGASSNAPTQIAGAWVARTGWDGTTLWQQFYPTLPDGQELIVSGAILADGYTWLSDCAISMGGSFWRLHRTDLAGKLLWQRKYYDKWLGFDLVAVPSGFAVLMGHYLTPQAYDPNWDSAIAFLDGEGNVVAQKAFGGPGTDMASAMIARGDGLAFSGRFDSGNVKSATAWLVAMDGWGNDACKSADVCALESTAGCNDGNPCTYDGCDPTNGCSHSALPVASPCGVEKVCSASAKCN